MFVYKVQLNTPGDTVLHLNRLGLTQQATKKNKMAVIMSVSILQHILNLYFNKWHTYKYSFRTNTFDQKIYRTFMKEKKYIVL